MLTYRFYLLSFISKVGPNDNMAPPSRAKGGDSGFSSRLLRTFVDSVRFRCLATIFFYLREPLARAEP